MALNNKPLFDDPIEAWVHGPVVPLLYNRFKKYGWSPIAENPAAPPLEKSITDHLDAVYSEYGRFSAWDLERMTHQEGPWQEARRGLAIDEEGHKPISIEDMQTFYSELAAA